MIHNEEMMQRKKLQSFVASTPSQQFNDFQGNFRDL
jgi:hypothetical protein